jgi:hypothetical protein
MYELSFEETTEINGGLSTVMVVMTVVGFIGALEPAIDAVNDVIDGYNENRR